MKAIGYLFTTIFVIVYGSIVNGWALCKLWSWFVVPTFSLPALSIPAAIGLASVVSYLTYHPELSKKSSDKPYWETLLTGFIWNTLKPAIALLCGSIVKIWM